MLGGRGRNTQNKLNILKPCQLIDSHDPDQSWGSVWPAPRTFHPAIVPLHVRQGVIQTKAQVFPSKYGSLVNSDTAMLQRAVSQTI